MDGKACKRVDPSRKLAGNVGKMEQRITKRHRESQVVHLSAHTRRDEEFEKRESIFVSGWVKDVNVSRDHLARGQRKEAG